MKGIAHHAGMKPAGVVRQLVVHVQIPDAPAIREAHIGIAMGGRGSDVAREASDLVLLDDTFSSLVEAVRLGRRIFDNMQHAMAYVLAAHVPIAGMVL